MSYDLLVFEKTKAPKTKKEFIKWYKKLTEWEESIDYNQISNASNSLQNWFHEIIKTFPPMNGSLAPKDEEINGNKELELHLTDYSITKDAIYACFSWSLSDEAYNTVLKLAAKHKVGFFDASGKNKDIILPDEGSLMFVSGEWFNRTMMNDFSLIEKKIDSMTVKNRSYLYMADMNENYIQIGGYADRFVVEIRLYEANGKFTHYKANISSDDTSDDEIVIIGGQNIKVRPSQILTGEISVELFKSFFDGEKLSKIVCWKDITDMFI